MANNINKFEDNRFLNEINDFDLVALAEAHKGYNSTFEIENFKIIFSICRDLSSNGRYYGGLAILRKNSVKEHVQILPTTCKDYQWLKIDKDYFGLASDLYLCTVYIPPANSSYTKKLSYDIIDLFEKDLIQFKSKGDFCVDFNARTASE